MPDCSMTINECKGWQYCPIKLNTACFEQAQQTTADLLLLKTKRLMHIKCVHTHTNIHKHIDLHQKKKKVCKMHSEHSGLFTGDYIQDTVPHTFSIDHYHWIFCDYDNSIICYITILKIVMNLHARQSNIYSDLMKMGMTLQSPRFRCK